MKKKTLQKLLTWQIMITMDNHYEEKRENNDLSLPCNHLKKWRTGRSHLFALLIAAFKQRERWIR